MSVFGTRPDTIKMAPVVHALREHPQIDDVVCVTAQHRKMLDDLLALFAIAPDYDLNVMTEDQTLTQVTTRVLTRMEGVLADAAPDVVLVHGDTTTSTAAALAAFYRQIPVGHVEAGLRTKNRWLPYPEEMNRRLTGAITSYHFAPTSLAREHLLVENVAPDDIVVTGNTVIDAFLDTAAREDLPDPPRWREDRSQPADDRRHRAPPRESRAHARDLRSAAGDCRTALAAAALLAGSPVAARCSRSLTPCSTTSRASFWSIRSTMPRWSRRSETRSSSSPTRVVFKRKRRVSVSRSWLCATRPSDPRVCWPERSSWSARTANASSRRRAAC